MTTVMTTEQLMCLLRAKHTGQQWAFFEEVPDATGSAKGRTADALAMGIKTYVVGIEPCTNRPAGRMDARERGELIVLDPGESSPGSRRHLAPQLILARDLAVRSYGPLP